jgi:hypothetical protein
MGRLVDLQDTFRNIPDEIEFTLPYAERYLERDPESDKLIYMIKIINEMIIVLDVGNTQAYSDYESSKETKIAQRMHNFIINKTVLEQKAPAPGIKCKSKYLREMDGEEEGDKFVFSDNEWVLEDNGQQLASIKRNKNDDYDKDPDGMGSARMNKSEFHLKTIIIM